MADVHTERKPSKGKIVHKRAGSEVLQTPILLWGGVEKALLSKPFLKRGGGADGRGEAEQKGPGKKFAPRRGIESRS